MKLYRMFRVLLCAFAAGAILTACKHTEVAREYDGTPNPEGTFVGHPGTNNVPFYSSPQPEKPAGEIGRRDSLRWRYFVTITPEQIKAAQNAQDSYPAEDDRDGKWGPNWDGLQLSIRLQKETFTNGEPVMACITLRNAGDKVQYFHTAEPGPELDTKLFLMREGKRILGVDDPKPDESFLERVRHVRTGSSWTEPISPGTQRQFFRDLSKVFDLRVLGNYSAQAERTVIAADNLPDRPGYIRAVSSNLLSGTVTFRIGRSAGL